MALNGPTLHYYHGEWIEGNPPLISPMSLATWMSATVFDGARGFDGVTPDLDKHCARLINSSEVMGLRCPLSVDELMGLAHAGIKRFANGEDVYIRPMVWGDTGFISPDPESSDIILSLIKVPIPKAKGIAVTLSPYRRPNLDTAPTDAKAGCLYPNSARAMREAHSRGFNNAVMLDANGNVSELATANIWMVKDGVAMTPVPNGTFLNGITRQRMIALLKADGMPVLECSLRYEDLLDADELFLTGNATKVTPITKLDQRSLQMGRVAMRARELYWDWSHSLQPIA